MKRKMSLVNIDGLLEILQKKCDMAGSVERWAKRQRPVMSFSYIYGVLRKEVPPKARMLKALKARELPPVYFIEEEHDVSESGRKILHFEDID